MRKKRNSHTDLVIGREGKRSSVRYVLRWEDIIKMDKQMGSEG
jgi:hypothetical protein